MDRLAALTDLVIVSADGRDFDVSKAMVAALSVVLANMFTDCKGGIKTRGGSTADDKVTLEDQSGDVITLLNHAYTGPKFEVTNINVGSCVRVAAKYDTPRLLEACHDYLDKLQLGVRVLPGWLEVAPTYLLPRFTKRCMEYAAAYLQHIIDSRVEQKLAPTDWLEKLPPSTLVEMLQLRTRVVGCLATTLGKQDKPLTDQEVVQLEKQPRTF